ncbi:MAG TPA: twin-arginine translocation signal domain-containing protein [Kaistia sp.]|nr:twin-arginine translocation signal domain-containing protein [Kaistia sp.]
MTSSSERGGATRRGFLKGTAGLAAMGAGVNLFNINHAWSADAVYEGGVFDAGGATLNIAEWGGFWEEIVRKEMLDAFEKDFNCKIVYESSFPWFPKFVAGGPEKPPFAIANWNYGEMFKTAAAGDFFTPLDEVIANVPNAKNIWPFATATGVGVTWSYTRYCYAYRTDLVDPAIKTFKDFWEEKFAGKRGTYVTSNGLQMDFFIASCALFGKDQYDLDAGYEAMKQAMPMKISDFTGNMQTLLERGEVILAVQHDAEVYQMMDRGIKVAPYLWEEKKPILTQTKTISKYLEPVQKKLAYALLNLTLDQKLQSVMCEKFYQRPVNKDVVVTPNLASKGVANTADATAGYWTPDWKSYNENEADIVETVNGIFAG